MRERCVRMQVDAWATRSASPKVSVRQTDCTPCTSEPTGHTVHHFLLTAKACLPCARATAMVTLRVRVGGSISLRDFCFSDSPICGHCVAMGHCAARFIIMPVARAQGRHSPPVCGWGGGELSPLRVGRYGGVKIFGGSTRIRQLMSQGIFIGVAALLLELSLELSQFLQARHRWARAAASAL